MQEFLKSALVEMVAGRTSRPGLRRFADIVAEADGPGPQAEQIVADLREMRGSL